MRKLAYASASIAVIALSAAWTGLMVYRQRPTLPVAGLLHRSTVDPTVDRGGHSRGIVQVDLLRQIMADRARAVPAAAEQGDQARHRVPSQSHPLLGRPAPPFALQDSTGRIWKRREALAREPVILVFSLGQTCMACVTHLVKLDFAVSPFRDRGARVLAISADSPEFSRRRLDRFGDLRVPLLSDPDHAIALAYGVWKPLPGGEKDDGEPLHGTFIVDRDGLVRWAYVGDRPFADVEALLAELAHWERDRDGFSESKESR
jgi:peroxiredoxin